MLGSLGLAALVAADVALVGYTVGHHATPPSYAGAVAVAASASPSPSSSPVPSGAPSVVAATGMVGADGSLSTVTSTRCPGVRLEAAGALRVLPDGSCGPTVTGLAAPVSGVVGLAPDSVWWVSAGLHVAAGSSVTKRPDPCAAAAMPAAYVVPSSSTVGVVVCARKPTKQGQARLVYGTRDGGATWAQPSGAYSVGSGHPDGLDADGRLVDVASFGGPSLGVLLASSGCGGLQLRTSADLGASWTTAGCLPAGVPDSARLAGAGSAVYVVAVVDGAVRSWRFAAGRWTGR